jgi:hypothetical protein
MAAPENSAGPTPVGAEQPTATRLLSASAKGSERVARATGVDVALNQAAEKAIVVTWDRDDLGRRGNRVTRGLTGAGCPRVRLLSA